MALTPKERERIIEEEQLRFETRQTLHRESCAKNRPNRWLWRVAIILLVVAAWHHWRHCGFEGCQHGWMGQEGHHCIYQDGAPGQGADAGVAPGQPIPQKK